jgi:hypothetical protein
MELHEVELRLETVSIELEELAKILAEIEQRANALLEGIRNGTI